jgi:hypothetical protein
MPVLHCHEQLSYSRRVALKFLALHNWPKESTSYLCASKKLIVIVTFGPSLLKWTNILAFLLASSCQSPAPDVSRASSAWMIWFPDADFGDIPAFAEFSLSRDRKKCCGVEECSAGLHGKLRQLASTKGSALSKKCSWYPDV